MTSSHVIILRFTKQRNNIPMCVRVTHITIAYMSFINESWCHLNIVL